MVESQIRTQKRPDIKTEDDAINSGGDPAFLAFLALNENVPVMWLEPPQETIEDAVLKTFSREELAYWYFANIMDNWNRNGCRENLDSHIIKQFDRDSFKRGVWARFDFSLNNLSSIHKKLFGKDLDIHDQKFFNSVSSPNETDTAINRLARIKSDMRDVGMVRNLINYSVYHHPTIN